MYVNKYAFWVVIDGLEKFISIILILFYEKLLTNFRFVVSDKFNFHTLQSVSCEYLLMGGGLSSSSATVLVIFFYVIILLYAQAAC